MNLPYSLLVTLMLVFATSLHAEPAKFKTPNESHTHRRELHVSNWPTDGKLQLEGPLPSIIKAWVQNEDAETPLEFTFNKDASVATLHCPEKATAKIQFLVADNTAVLSDGVVVLSALDSEVVGKQAKLETHPGNHRIGFWGNPADYVQWKFTAPPGRYTAELVYSRASPDGTEVEISVGETKFPLALKTTESWYRYRTVKLGEVVLPQAEEHLSDVRVRKIINGGVMNLKAIVLTPHP